MEYMMRRFKQQLSKAETEEILLNGRECVLAVCDEDGSPYAVPVNYVYDGVHIYIHSAKEGHKIEALRNNPRISLCVIAQGDIVPKEFTTYFRSAIVFGTVKFVGVEADKIKALWKLCEKYCKGLDATQEISRFLKNVEILEVTIERMTGKEAIELTRLKK